MSSSSSWVNHGRQLLAGRSCTVQLLPSGSLKKMNEFQSPPRPSTRPPSPKCWTALTSTPPPEQLLPRGVDVRDDQLDPLHRRRGRRGHTVPDGDRAG